MITRWRRMGMLGLLLAGVLSGSDLYASYGGGAGTPGNPYIISMAGHLATLSTTPGDWGSCFRLTADVSAGSYVPVTVFTGVFDGNGYSISGFSCSTGTGYVGFFGKVQGATACVKNLELVSPSVNVSGASYVGAIAGSVEGGGIISGCSVTDGSVTGYDQTGGMVGSNIAGSIIGCKSSTAVSGHSYVGGLVGRNEQYCIISDCDVVGQVSADQDYCGGFAGKNIGTILRCSASGGVIGKLCIGGLVGWNGDTSYPGQVSKSLAIGAASGTSYVGGLVGRNHVGQINDSYALGSVTTSGSRGGGLVGKNESSATVARCYSAGEVGPVGSQNLGGLVGECVNVNSVTSSFWDTTTSGQLGPGAGTGKTTFEMQQIATFTIAGVGWDFLGETTNGTADIWRMCVNGVDYPHQQWEWPRGDVSCPDGVEFVDFAVFAAGWGQTGAGLKGDLDGSGAVGLLDLAIFAADWRAGMGGGLPG
jgi:hypothetical protein